MKTILGSLFFFFGFQLFGQTINFTDPVFKQRLLQSNPGNFIAQNLNGDYFKIDSNSNNQIEVNEALAVSYLNVEDSGISDLGEINYFSNLTGLNCNHNNLQSLNVSLIPNLIDLNCSYNLLSNLNIANTTQLQVLDCSNNALNQLDLSSGINLEQLYCDHNLLSSFNFLGNAIQLENLNCSNNSLTQIDITDLVVLKYFDCSNNLLTNIDFNSSGQLINLNVAHNSITSLVLINLNQLQELDCSYNALSQLVLQNLIHLTTLSLHHNTLTSLGFIGLTSIQSIDCSFNQLTAIDISDYTTLLYLDTSYNAISSLHLLNVSSLLNLDIQHNALQQLTFDNSYQIRYLNCSFNTLQILDISQLVNLVQLNCSSNNINALNVQGNNFLQSLIANNNEITILDCSSNISLVNVEIQQNLLTQLNIKNGVSENLVNFSNNPSLVYLCCDYSELSFIQYLITLYNQQNCIVNDFCSSPSNYNLLTLDSQIDSNTNGLCDTNDIHYPFLRLKVADSNEETVYFSSKSGLFTHYFSPNYYYITPEVLPLNNFSISPSEAIVDFPADAPFSNTFCVGHQASSNDLEVVVFQNSNLTGSNLLSLSIVFKNNGNLSANGTLQLNFESNSFVYSSSSSTPLSFGNGTINWNFINILPGETRVILVTFQIIGVPTNTVFSANITNNLALDDQPDDNIFIYQMPNLNLSTDDLIALNGNQMSSSALTKYQYYSVTYSNTSNQTIQQLNIQLQIPNYGYDIATFCPVFSNNNDVISRMNISSVDLLFPTLHLEPNQSFVYVFKIKANSSLQVGDQINLVSNIFNSPSTIALTSQVTTTIQDLKNINFQQVQVTIYPNPCYDFIEYKVDGFEPTFYEIYDVQGRLIRKKSMETKIQTTSFETGLYFILFSDGKNKTVKRFYKN